MMAFSSIPFGKGRAYFTEGLADKIIGGFQLGVIVLARSGYPFSVVDGDNGSTRASLIGDPFAAIYNGRYLNVNSFTGGNLSVTNGAGTVIRFGSLGRNTFHGPNITRWDASLVKNTAITEKFKLQIGFDFQNVFNSAIYTVPNNNFRDRGGFGRFDSAFPGRVVQYKAKVIF